MPNRIVREGILTSERVDRLSPQAEVFYRRLINIVDDFGRFDGRQQVIRAAAYPLKLDTVSNEDVAKWMEECANADLVTIYSSGGKQFISLIDFKQQIRAQTSKYPAPECVADAQQMHSRCAADAKQMLSTCVADAQQMLSDAHLGGVGVGVEDDICAHAQQALDLPTSEITEIDIYEAYPRKKAKPAALRAIKAAMKKVAPVWLLERTRAFALMRESEDPSYTPYPATWFNQERYNDPIEIPVPRSEKKGGGYAPNI